MTQDMKEYFVWSHAFPPGMHSPQLWGLWTWLKLIQNNFNDFKDTVPEYICCPWPSSKTKADKLNEDISNWIIWRKKCNSLLCFLNSDGQCYYHAIKTTIMWRKSSCCSNQEDVIEAPIPGVRLNDDDIRCLPGLHWTTHLIVIMSSWELVTDDTKKYLSVVIVPPKMGVNADLTVTGWSMVTWALR